jgi:hypothetical protein
MQNSGLATRLAVHLYPTVRSIYRLFVTVDLLNGVSAGDLHIRIVFSTAPVRTDPTPTRKEKIDTSSDLASSKPRSRSTPAAACLHRRAHPRPDSGAPLPRPASLAGVLASRPASFAGAAHRLSPWFAATGWNRVVLGGEGCRRTSPGRTTLIWALATSACSSSFLPDNRKPPAPYLPCSSSHGHRGSSSCQPRPPALHPAARTGGRGGSSPPTLPLLF